MSNVIEIADAVAWQQPQTLEPTTAPTDLNLDVLPQIIADHVADQAGRMGVDRNMLALFDLVTCAAAIDDGIKVSPKQHDPSWTESARVWLAAVAEPSAKKSPALKSASTPLRKLDMDWRKSEANDREQFAIAKKIYQSKMRAYVNAQASNNTAVIQPVKPTPPEVHRAIVEDQTTEALAEILSMTRRGTLMHRDELSGWFGSMDAYRGGNVSKDRPFWLQAYNGGPYAVDRVGKGSMLIPNLGVSVVGGIQPELMRKVAGKIEDDGLLQRFNIVLAKPAGREHDRPRNQLVYDDWERLIYAIADLKPRDGWLIRFDDDAQEIAYRFTDEVRNLTTLGDALPGQLRTHLGKWQGQFARYCLLVHCIETASRALDPYDHKITATTAENVGRLFRELFYPHALTFYSDYIESSELMTDARNVGGFILAHGLETIDRRKIQRSIRALRKSTEWQIHRVMDLLTGFGWVAPRVDQKIPPHRVWNVNPHLHTRFEALAKQEAERRARDYATLQAKFMRPKRQ